MTELEEINARYGVTPNRKQIPVFDKQYCDDNNIRCKWFPFDDHLQTLLDCIVDESVNPDGHWILDGSQLLGITMFCIMQYQQYGYIQSVEAEKLLQRREAKTARKAFEYAVELIEKSRIVYAKKVYFGRNNTK